MPLKGVVDKNLELLGEFMRYAFDHPEVLDQIPKGAEIVILPDDDPELCKENLKIAKSHQKKGLPVVVVRMQMPKPVPPRIEVLSIAK